MLLPEPFDSYDEARANIIRVASLLSDTCTLLNVVKNVPLRALPRLMQILEAGAATIGSALGPPQTKYFDLVQKAADLRNRFDNSPVGKGIHRLE